MKQSVRKSVENDLTEQMSEDRPGDFNQAMMELGAVVCVPNGAAKCEECPLGHFCLARKHGTVEELPVKAPKKARTIEQRTVLVIQDGAGTAIRNVRIQDFWQAFMNFQCGRTSDGEGGTCPGKSMGLEPLRIEALPDAKHIFPILNGGCVLIVSLYPLWKKHRRGSSCLWIRENPIKNMQYHLRFAHTPDI